MSSRIRGNYFKSQDDKDALKLSDCLLGLAVKPIQLRSAVTGVDIEIRLESIFEEDGLILGDFVRVQRQDIPHEAGEDTLTPITLADNAGLGHTAAFVLDPETEVILLQKNIMGTSQNRLALYMKKMIPVSAFRFTPILRKDTYARFQRMKPKRMTVRFAAPEDLSAVEDPSLSARAAAGNLAAIYGGPEIEFTVSVGKRKGSYLNKEMVSQDVLEVFAADETVSKLQVFGESDDPQRSIDFMRDVMQMERSKALTTDDVEQNRAERIAVLRDDFAANRLELMELFRQRQ